MRIRLGCCFCWSHLLGLWTYCSHCSSCWSFSFYSYLSTSLFMPARFSYCRVKPPSDLKWTRDWSGWFSLISVWLFVWRNCVACLPVYAIADILTLWNIFCWGWLRRKHSIWSWRVYVNFPSALLFSSWLSSWTCYLNWILINNIFNLLLIIHHNQCNKHIITTSTHQHIYILMYQYPHVTFALHRPLGYS